MSNAQTAAGAVLSIGAAAPGTYNKAGYEAVTWQAVGEVSNISGDIGKVFSLATYSILADRGLVKRKGQYDNGSITVEYAYYRADAGQEDMLAAVSSDAPLPIRIVMTDAGDTRVYFMGLIMGTPITIGGTEDFIVCSVQIEIDSVSAVLQENAPA